MNSSKAEEMKRIFGEAFYLEEYWHSPGGRAIREVVFGFNDGLVSTVGFVVGVASTLAHTHLVLFTGLAEVTAGAFSMCFGAYLSTKNQREFFEREIERERSEIDQMPEREKDEVRRIYAAKGFEGAELEMVVKRITSDRNVWLKCMMEEELGLIYESMDSPFKVGLITGLSFVLGGLVPLIPFLGGGDAPRALGYSIVISSVGLFIMGILKTFLTKRHWLKSGLESLAVGLLATGVGLLFGKIASALTGIRGLP